MNMFKKNGGFTLVELIVVIAILAILAGVSIPVYSGYISRAQATQDDALIASVETAINSAIAFVAPTDKTVTVAVVDATAETREFNFTFKNEKVAENFKSFAGAAAVTANAATNATEWTVKVGGFKYAKAMSYDAASGQLTITDPAQN